MYTASIPAPNKTDFTIYKPEQKDSIESLAYKKVANRIKPVATTLPEEFRIVRKMPSKPLEEMPKMPINPPEFTPGKRYKME